uniref:Uncharacterized protein n=1 Tax=Panagrolaimus superbus TaxID=310955 RepID=A0A914XZT5_9BILA
MTTKKENDNGDILNAETEGTHEVQLIGMDDLDILKDTEFFDYLLQTLTDHYAKLSGLKNVKIRAEFTKEFFARYWLLLMKCAEFDIVPPVNVSDDISAFDSIHRSIFEICESRINLRITTHFILRAEKLANEDEIEARNLFMLVLLFVSEWIADEKENSPNLTFKQSMAKEVHECFCKLFKEIFHGDNEDFKNRVFNENKEMSHSSPLPFHSSPNRSFDTPSLPSLNITPNVQVSAHEKNAQNEFLKKEIGELKVVVSSHVMDEEKLEKENNVLQRELAEKRLEIGDVNKQNVEIVEENRYLQQDLNKKKNELSEANNLIIQKEAEMKFIVNEIESLTGVINSLQMKYDLCNDELSKNIVESNCLKEENEELEKAVNRKTRTAEKLEEEKNVLRHELAEKRLEIGDVNKQNVEIAEENRYLQQDLNKKKNELSESNNIIIQKEAELNVIVNEIESLTGVINSLQMKYDLCNDELNKNFVENECLKEENEKLEKAVNRKTRTVEKLEEEKQVLQQALDSKTMELNEAKQLFSRLSYNER